MIWMKLAGGFGLLVALWLGAQAGMEHFRDQGREEVKEEYAKALEEKTREAYQNAADASSEGLSAAHRLLTDAKRVNGGLLDQLSTSRRARCGVQASPQDNSPGRGQPGRPDSQEVPGQDPVDVASAEAVTDLYTQLKLCAARVRAVEERIQ
jgi:hypothetical protein